MNYKLRVYFKDLTDESKDIYFKDFNYYGCVDKTKSQYFTDAEKTANELKEENEGIMSYELIKEEDSNPYKATLFSINFNDKEREIINGMVRDWLSLGWMDNVVDFDMDIQINVSNIKWKKLGK